VCSGICGTRSAIATSRKSCWNEGCTWTHIPTTTIYRWVQHSAPELKKRCRPHLKATTDSWKVDETSITVKKDWQYLYRAVDSRGYTLDFMLSSAKDGEAAKRFFLKILACNGYFAHPFEDL